MLVTALVLMVLGGGHSAIVDARIDLGSPVEAYVLEPGYLMTVARDANGRIREMVVERANVAGSDRLIVGDSEIPDEMRECIVDRLVPVSKRGPKKPIPKWLNSSIGGGVVSANHSYERVSIWYYSSYRGSSGGVLVITFSEPIDAVPPK